MKRIFCVLSVLLFFSCNRAVFKTRWTHEKAPATYIVRFETSKGQFDVKVNREWSPLAADRFYQLAKHHFLDSAVFYRVVPNFVAQFGSSDTIKMDDWSKIKVPDEPVLHSNIKGGISFARSGKDTRGRQLFINLKDNPRLDTTNYKGVKGFPSFGDVINGMDVVYSLNSKYGDSTMHHLDDMYTNRDKFNKSFPALDIIRKAYVLKK